MSLWSNTDAQISKPKYFHWGQIQAMNVTAGGSGYTNGTVAATISAPQAGGVQAAANVTIAGGIVTAITITNPGSNYAAAPTISVTSGGGSGATFSSFAAAIGKNTSGLTTANDSIVFVDFEESQKTANRIKGIKIARW